MSDFDTVRSEIYLKDPAAMAALDRIEAENAELRRQLEERRQDHLSGITKWSMERAQLEHRLQKSEADSRRLDWLVKELNDLHSNVTRDVFGLAGDEEGDLTIEFIDAAIAASEKEQG